MGKDINHAVLEIGQNKSGSDVFLTQNIEDVYFISIEGEIIENTLDQWEARYLFHLTVEGYDFYKDFGGKYYE